MISINLSPDEIDMIVDALDEMVKQSVSTGNKEWFIIASISQSQLTAISKLADMLGTK